MTAEQKVVINQRRKNPVMEPQPQQLREKKKSQKLLKIYMKFALKIRSFFAR